MSVAHRCQHVEALIAKGFGEGETEASGAAAGHEDILFCFCHFLAGFFHRRKRWLVASNRGKEKAFCCR